MKDRNDGAGHEEVQYSCLVSSQLSIVPGLITAEN